MGTAQKGEYWINTAIEEKIDHIQEIIEQHEKRKAKRLHDRQEERNHITG
jgi:hypothetical protein